MIRGAVASILQANSISAEEYAWLTGKNAKQGVKHFNKSRKTKDKRLASKKARKNHR